MEISLLSVVLGGLLGAAVSVTVLVTFFGGIFQGKVLDVIEDQVLHGGLVSRSEFETSTQIVLEKLDAFLEHARGIERIEREQLLLAAKLENGIRSRLDGVILTQQDQQRTMTELIGQINRMAGVLESSTRNWDGKERRV